MMIPDKKWLAQSNKFPAAVPAQQVQRRRILENAGLRLKCRHILDGDVCYPVQAIQPSAKEPA
jgi:hypothetical protein